MRGIQSLQPTSLVTSSTRKHKRWLPIYIGEGNLTQRAGPNPRGVECIDAKGATHIHVHVNYDREDHIAEVKDLLNNFPHAYTPDGCNEK